MKRAAIALGYSAAALLVVFFVLAVIAVWTGEGRFWGLGFLAVAAAVVVGIVAVVFAGMADSKPATTIIGRDS